MKTRNKHITLFTTTGCLTFEALEEYVLGELDKIQRQKIKSHVKHCDMCREAIEGYRLSDNRNKAFLRVKRINKNIYKSYGNSGSAGRKGSLFVGKSVAYHAAASIIILLGLFGYFRLNENETQQNGRRLLGDNIEISDSGYYNNYLGELDYLYTETEEKKPEFNTIEKKLSNNEKESLDLIYELDKEIQDLITTEAKKVVGNKQKYILLNDMIIGDSEQPEFLTSIKDPFDIYVRKKIDSLLEIPNIQYEITAEFVVSKEGMIKHPKILSSSNSELDDFTKKVLEESHWKPATINSTPVDYPVRLQIVKE